MNKYEKPSYLEVDMGKCLNSDCSVRQRDDYEEIVELAIQKIRTRLLKSRCFAIIVSTASGNKKVKGDCLQLASKGVDCDTLAALSLGCDTLGIQLIEQGFVRYPTKNTQ